MLTFFVFCLGNLTKVNAEREREKWKDQQAGNDA